MKLALVDAAKLGNKEKLKRMLRYKRKIPFTPRALIWALLEACRGAHYDCAVLLLERGVQVNSLAPDDNSGLSPLHLVAMAPAERECDALKLAGLLLQKGAELDRVTRNTGFTPLIYACAYGNFLLAQFFMAKGSNVQVRMRHGETLLYHLCERRARSDLIEERQQLEYFWQCLGQQERGLTVEDIQGHDWNGSTPLHYVAKSGRIEVAKFLLHYGADINARNWMNQTPLHVAVSHDQIDMVRFLVKNKARLVLEDAPPDVGRSVQKSTEKNENDNIPAVDDLVASILVYTSPILHHAASLGRLDMIKFLVEEHDPHLIHSPQSGFQRMTPLHYAVLFGRGDVIQWLLGKGAPVHAQDAFGRTPLHWACHLEVKVSSTKNCANDIFGCQDPFETLRLLMDHGADANQPDSEGSYPLHYLVQRPSDPLPMIRLLVEKDATGDMSPVNRQGDTPLALAASQGHKEVVWWLVKQIANYSSFSASPLRHHVRKIAAPEGDARNVGREFGSEQSFQDDVEDGKKSIAIPPISLTDDRVDLAAAPRQMTSSLNRNMAGARGGPRSSCYQCYMRSPPWRYQSPNLLWQPKIRAKGNGRMIQLCGKRCRRENSDPSRKRRKRSPYTNQVPLVPVC